MNTDSDRAELAKPEPARVTDEEWEALKERVWDHYKTVGYQGELFIYDCDFDTALDDVRRELARWGQPAQLEPRGCPTPGACSCPTAPVVPPDVIHVLEQVEAGLSQHLPRIQQMLERWRGHAEETPLAQPEPGEARELSRCLLLISEGMAAHDHELDSWLVARAAALLQQLAPIPTSGTRSQSELSEAIKNGATFEKNRITAIIDHTATHLHEIKEIGEVDPAFYTFGRLILRRLSKVIKDLPDFEISFDDESEPTP